MCFLKKSLYSALAKGLLNLQVKFQLNPFRNEPVFLVRDLQVFDGNLFLRHALNKQNTVRLRTLLHEIYGKFPSNDSVRMKVEDLKKKKVPSLIWLTGQNLDKIKVEVVDI